VERAGKRDRKQVSKPREKIQRGLKGKKQKQRQKIIDKDQENESSGK